MLYLSGNVKGNLLGVVDTDDNIEEFYSKEYLLSTGLEIIRLNKELKVGYTFGTKCFDFKLVEEQGILGWQLKAKIGVSVFKNKPYYLGYPVISLYNCFLRYDGKTIDLRSMDTSQVRDMGCMFQYCSSLTSLDLSNFNTSQVRDMLGMFRGCSNLTSLNLSNFNTSQVEDMEYMFRDCLSLTSLDLSSFNTSQVEDMSYMFKGCSSLISLDLSNFDTSQVKYMMGMFVDCSKLVLKVSNTDLISDSVRLNLVKYPNDEVNFNKVVDNIKQIAKLILTMPSGSIIGVKEW